MGIVHDFNFLPCNCDQNTKLLSPKERIKRLKALGYGGIVISPSFKDYLSDESIKNATELIKYANEQGLLVWIYDELYYPSGSAGGIVPKEHPEYEAKGLAVLTADALVGDTGCINSPHGYNGVYAAYCCRLNSENEPIFETILDISEKKNFGGGVVYKNNFDSAIRVYAFFGKTTFEFATTSHNTRIIRRYIDTLDKNAVSAFFEATYGKYKKFTESITDLIEGVFTDEPQIPALCRENYRADYREWVLENQNDVFKVYDMPDSKITFTPYIPWTDNIEKVFKAKFGYDLLINLPLLFFDKGEKGNKVRADFWQTVSDMFLLAYNETYRDFCEKRQITYSGHFLHEEEFNKHPYMHGDLLMQLGKMPLPGCDYLSASPKKILENASAAKFASSAAALYGNNQCMAEVSNMVSDISPITAEDYKLATALQTALGITRFFSYYTDFCMPDEDVKGCLDFTKNITKALSNMAPVRNCYLYLPNKTFMGESFPTCAVNEKIEFSKHTKETEEFMLKAPEVLLRAGIDFNFINDDCLEKIANGKAPECFNPQGSVLIIAPWVDVPKELTKSFENTIIVDDVKELVGALLKYDLQNISADPNGSLISLYKQGQTQNAFLLVNASDECLENVCVNGKFLNEAKSFCIYNPHTDIKEDSNSPIISIPKKEARIIFTQR